MNLDPFERFLVMDRKRKEEEEIGSRAVQSSKVSKRPRPTLLMKKFTPSDANRSIASKRGEVKQPK